MWGVCWKIGGVGEKVDAPYVIVVMTKWFSFGMGRTMRSNLDGMIFGGMISNLSYFDPPTGVLGL